METRRKILLASFALDGIILILAALFFISNREKLDLNPTTRRGLPGRFVALSDGTTHYDLSGLADGPVIVLVNCFSVPAYVWDPNVSALARAGFRVLRYDLYGRGFSDRPAGPYDLALFVRQLDELVRALDLPTPIHVAGLSMGGQIAAAYAARYPERVDRLALIDPQVVQVTPKTIFPMNLPGIGEYLMAVYIAPNVLPDPRDSFYDPTSFPDWLDRYRVQMQYRGFRRAVLSTLRDLGEDPMDSYALVGQQDKPVLLLWGEQDRTVPIANADKVRKAIPQADYFSIPQAGHLSNYERPNIVNLRLINFFE